MKTMTLGNLSESSKLQLIRYLLVGIFGNFIGYLAYLLLTYLGIAPKIAMTVLYLCTAIVSFFGNSRLTFSYIGNKTRSVIRYLISYALGYLMNLAILTVGVDQLGYSHEAVQAIAIVAVAIFLFLILKFYVFKMSQ